MNTKSAVVGFSFGLIVVAVATTALAQSDAPIAGDEIRREIVELRQTIQELSRRLEALERRLELGGSGRGVQLQGWKRWEGPDSYLLFSIEVERAMMAPPNSQSSPLDRLDFLPPRSSNEGQGALPSIPGPLDVPRLRP
jgi:hypothetical protein